MKTRNRIVDPVVGAVQGHQLKFICPTTGRMHEGVPCRICGCTLWTWYTTTSLELDTEHGTARPTNLVSRELRCAKCGRKATYAQTSNVIKTEAFSQAREQVVLEKARGQEDAHLSDQHGCTV